MKHRCILSPSFIKIHNRYYVWCSDRQTNKGWSIIYFYAFTAGQSDLMTWALIATNLSNLCMESARVLLSSSMMRLGACKLPYWSWSGWPWLWWRLDRAASWEGSKVPWWRVMPWGGPHFWERMLRGLGDGEGELEESSPPWGTQIITFLGGRGGECFPPGIQGNFIGWQESREKQIQYNRTERRITAHF